MFNTDLTQPAYRKLISDTFKQVDAHQVRRFSIRERIHLKHGKYKKNPFNRATYRLYGKNTILSVLNNASVMSKTESISSPKSKIVDKNWKNVLKGMSATAAKDKITIPRVDRMKLEEAVRVKSSDSSDDHSRDKRTRKASMKDAAAIISYQNILAKQEIATTEQMTRIEKQSTLEKHKQVAAEKAAIVKKKQENAWYYDAEEEDQIQEDNEDLELQVRFVETYVPEKFIVTEVCHPQSMNYVFDSYVLSLNVIFKS